MLVGVLVDVVHASCLHGGSMVGVLCERWLLTLGRNGFGVLGLGFLFWVLDPILN